jgi:hypothetical protein
LKKVLRNAELNYMEHRVHPEMLREVEIFKKRLAFFLGAFAN